MTFPVIFNNLPSGNVPAADLDTMFTTVGQMAVVHCAASGSNTIALSPGTNMPTQSAYVHQQYYDFVAIASSTATCVVNVSSLGNIPLYLPGGVSQAGSGNITNGANYTIQYLTGLNSGGGGAVITSSVPGSVVNPVSSSYALGLKITNDVSTPNTKIDITASSAVLINSTGGGVFVSPVSVTIDLTTGTVTSTAGGMDGEARLGTSYTASISNTTLTVAGVVTGFLFVGQQVLTTGTVTGGTYISATGTGTGGTGTYILNKTSTVSAGTVFTANNPVYAYLINNGTTTAGLATNVSPTTGTPSLPSGYLFSMYAGAMFLDPSQNLLRTRQLGRKTQYVITSATNTTAYPTPSNASGAAGSTYNTTTFTPAAASVLSVVPFTASSIQILVSTGTGTPSVAVAPNVNFSGFETTTPPPITVTDGNVGTVQGTIELEATTIQYASSSATGLAQAIGWEDYYVTA